MNSGLMCCCLCAYVPMPRPLKLFVNGEVVGEYGAGEPGAVGSVVPGGDVFETGAFFEVADGELDNGVVAVNPSGGVVTECWPPVIP